MFSLIITLISIALVAALALATIYLGGEAWTRTSAQAYATTILTHGNQLASAWALYRSDMHSIEPNLITDLAPDYLSSIPPLPPGSLPIEDADLGNGQWYIPNGDTGLGSGNLDEPERTHFAYAFANEPTCQFINQERDGIWGPVPAADDLTLIYNCYGDSANNEFIIRYTP